MGKHNGKSRSTGSGVGKALSNQSKQGFKKNAVDNFKHTSDLHQEQQSILEQSDLDSIMAMAVMAGRDFKAEREKVVILDSQAPKGAVPRLSGSQQCTVEERVTSKLKIPRRPPWSSIMSAAVLDQNEREMFLNWRRSLAKLEENEPNIVLTPFEKNLEVWRQLWRVLERSDIIVQVVDCRDPLLYRSKDLEEYAREIDPTKSSLLLLNKADLLSSQVRLAWADYFDSQGLKYGFWSAKTAGDDAEDEDTAATAVQLTCGEGGNCDKISLTIYSNENQTQEMDSRIRLLAVDEVLKLFEDTAREAIQGSAADDPRRSGDAQRLVAGLVGYPNVGKSSTINVLFGKKKTAVAATPGKTKHFQTLNVSESLCLCDCPGLVFPQVAQSKAQMVSAGVIPIDRLVDVHAPTQVVADKMGYRGLEEAYGIKLPRTKGRKSPLASELFAAVAHSRGWVIQGGLPDEARTGRVILKDFVNGKLLSVSWPPGYDGDGNSSEDDAVSQHSTEVHEPESEQDVLITPGDIDILQDATEPGTNLGKKKRASHKFQKKPYRTKGNRGQQWNDDNPKTVHAFVKGRGDLTNGMLGSLKRNQ